MSRYTLEWSRDGETWTASAHAPITELAWLQTRGRSLAGDLWLRKRGPKQTCCAVRIVDSAAQILWAYIRGEDGQIEEVSTEAPCGFCGGYGWRGMPEETCPECEGVGTVSVRAAVA